MPTPHRRSKKAAVSIKNPTGSKHYAGNGNRQIAFAIIPERRSAGSMLSATLVILPPGAYWNAWGLSEKHILRKMCILGRTKREIPFGRIPLFIPC